MTSWLKGGNARFLPKGQLSSEETEEFVRKKADVRDRLVHQVKAKKGIKKGFLNPERKRKLRELLFKKAAEDMKAEQERKAQERRRILEERIGHDKHSALNDAKALGEVCRQYYERVLKLVESSYDLEVKVRVKDYEINEMTIQVNDLRGKFVKPTLNKVKRAESQ
ncbi:hypothetical protein RvY_17610-2 [Ramazzottius varieornatus]|nr:hypothetical protein RvY_17610-2 [Ramazzottius varieornatus]